MNTVNIVSTVNLPVEGINPVEMQASALFSVLSSFE
jgi:hypothetical protein